MMRKILIIIGTRPNFIKVTQFKNEVKNFKNLEVIIAHTGQHYDKNMSQVFFDQFNLRPDYFMNVKGTSVSNQIGQIIIEIDKISEQVKPNMLISVGDVNSTLCASIVANKRGIKLGHLESGLRSEDRSMPEEINRILTDEISDHFFVTEQSGLDNLLKEGKERSQIHFVGNTMIDTMVAFEKQIESSEIKSKIAVENGEYILFTMHRPSNVDNKEGLIKTIDLLNRISNRKKVVFPIHPRTIQKLKHFGLFGDFDSIKNIVCLEPLDYFAFQNLISHAYVVVTDSGGIQEETTFKQVPCITIRNNTERPVTTEIGTNYLVEFNVDDIAKMIINGDFKNGLVPELWDGKSTQRILSVINNLI